MLRKLMKYEFKSTRGTFLIVYAVMVVLCGLTGIVDQINELLEERFPIWGILMAVTVLFLFASVIITTVLNINRFYKGLFKDEGYLIHTLPVHPWQIITAKLVPAVVWTIVTVLVMGLSCLLMVLFSSAFGPVRLDSLGEFFRELFRAMGYLEWREVASMLQVLSGLLITLVAVVLQVYAALSLGQLLPKHRVAGALVAWFLLNIIQELSIHLLYPMLGQVLYTGYTGYMFGAAVMTLSGDDPVIYPIMMAFYLAWCAIFWAVTQWVLTRRLNLE